MSTRIRLQRHGRKKRPYYFIVVADSRAPRDGKFIDRLGSYNPTTVPATIELDGDKALEWLEKGAQPSDTIEAIFRYKGVMYRKHLQRGVRKGAFDQEEADKQYAAFLDKRAKEIQDRIEHLSTEATKEERTRLEREQKVAEKRAEELRAKRAPEEAEEPEAAPEEATEAAEAPEAAGDAEAPGEAEAKQE